MNDTKQQKTGPYFFLQKKLYLTCNEPDIEKDLWGLQT